LENDTVFYTKHGYNGDFKAKVVPLNKLLFTDTLKSGLRIDNMKYKNLLILEQKLIRLNAIQISCEKYLISWAVGSGEEVKAIENYSTFTNVEDFLRTGFLMNKLPDHQKEKPEGFKYAIPFTSNYKQTLFCKPFYKAKVHYDRNSIGILFIPWSDLDVLEMRALANGVSRDRIDENSLVCDVYGKTIFDIMQNDTSLLPRV
jgi:hypothetical protein